MLWPNINIEQIDLFFAKFYCKKRPIYRSEVTGEIFYDDCTNELRLKCKDFKPKVITKILNFFGL